MRKVPETSELREILSVAQIEALESVCAKAKGLGWKMCADGPGCAQIESNGMIRLTLLGASKNKHFLRIARDGVVSFAPVTFVCGNSGCL